MNLIEALLNADEKKLTAVQTDTIEIKRLSNLLGAPFVIEVAAVPHKRISEINSTCTVVKRHGKTETNTYKVNMMLLVDGIKTKFSDKELLKKYGCATVMDLYEKLFNAGETALILNKISELSGVSPEDQEAILEEVKNESKPTAKAE